MTMTKTNKQITINNSNQIKLNSGFCINATVSDLELGVLALVGYHHYFRVGVTEAVAAVTESLKNAGMLGWRASYGECPNGSIRVGQVKVHSGASEYPLYVYKK